MPLRRGASRFRELLMLIGPLLWLIGLILVGIVTQRTDTIGIGIAVGLASFILAVGLLLLARAKRVRRESAQ